MPARHTTQTREPVLAPARRRRLSDELDDAVRDLDRLVAKTGRARPRERETYTPPGMVRLDVAVISLEDMASLVHDRCGRRHRSARTAARCQFAEGGYISVSGNGAYAVVSRCPVTVYGPFGKFSAITVMLHTTESEALERLSDIDEKGCWSAGDCVHDHRICGLTAHPAAA
jgi:hypothetical protein